MFFRLRLGIVVLVLGCTLLFYGFKEWRLGAVASTTPEDLTLEALIARGPDGNPNVRVSDFMLGDNYVYFTDDSGFRWTNVLIPAMPKTMGEQSAHVLNPQVIVKTAHAASEDDVDTLRSRTKMQGLVINRIEELGSEEKDMLRQDYPGLEFNKCLILEEGRQPSEFTKIFLMGGGGLALLFGGGWLLLYNFSRTT
jgi:hypothetical protein